MLNGLPSSSPLPQSFLYLALFAACVQPVLYFFLKKLKKSKSTTIKMYFITYLSRNLQLNVVYLWDLLLTPNNTNDRVT